MGWLQAVAALRTSAPARSSGGTGTRRPLHVGERVRVRSREDLLASVDESGRLDGMPLMPEMLSYAGQELPVFRSAHKTCDTIRMTGTTRQLDGTVHLSGARCDGSAHGGCQAGCLLFWREEWLERPDGTPLRAPARRTAPARPGVVTEQTLHQDTVASVAEDGTPRYRCMATELVRASRPLSALSLRQYLLDIRTGNADVRGTLRGLLVTAVNKYQTLSKRLPMRLRVAGGANFPFYRGTGPSPAPAPLNLRPGDLVEVRSREEILPTLGPGNRNRGLWFDGEMLPHCGKRGRVTDRVERIIEEPTGRMLTLRDCIVVEGMTCTGRYNRNCPRDGLVYWREAWLRRADRPGEPTS